MSADGNVVPVPKSSIQLTHRTDRSLLTAVLHKIIRPFGPRLVKPKDEFPPGSPRLQPNAYAKKKCTVHERQVDDIWIYDITAKDRRQQQRSSDNAATAKARRPYRIYYFAGGGWQSPPSSHHWRVLALLATQLPAGSSISLVSYPLAPRSPAPATFPRLLALYGSLLRAAADADEVVTLAGDSAGGNIVLALTLEALRADSAAPRPHSLLAICPSVELGGDNPQLEAIERHDPVLRIHFINATAQAWAGEWPTDDPRLSPLHADIAVLREAGVLVDGLTAGYDLLGPDGVLFRRKCEEESVRGEWLHWDRMMHCWPLAKTYGIFPESAQAWDWIVRVLERRAR